ncbi:MAG: NUDIX domain-containing protein [Planctomycetes bacterium]|nr:NUDIX domain-containing protein [Planctomycetota bacterium]
MDSQATPAAAHELLLALDVPLEAVRFETAVERGVEWTDERRQSLLAVLERDRVGARKLERRPDGSLPSLYRLHGVRREGERVALEVGTTDYAEYLATNVAHPEWRAMFGSRALADPLGLSGVLLEGRGRIVLGRRSRDLPVDAGRWHIVPAGHPFAPQTPLEALRDEARGELGLDADELLDARCTGIFRVAHSGKPELACFARTNRTLEELASRARSEAWEHDELLGLAWEPRTIAAWLANERARTAPAGHGAVLCAGRASFGDAWWSETLARLALDAPR